MSDVIQTVETDAAGVATVIDAATGGTVASGVVLHAKSSFEDVIAVIKAMQADLSALKSGGVAAGAQVGVDVLQAVSSISQDVADVKADVAKIKPAFGGIQAFWKHLF